MSKYVIVKDKKKREGEGKKALFWTGRVWSKSIENAVQYAEVPPDEHLPEDHTRVVKDFGRGEAEWTVSRSRNAAAE